MYKYFVFDRYNGNYDFYETEEEARKEAKKILEDYADDAAYDGWPDDMDGVIGYAEIKQITKETTRVNKLDFTDEEWEDMNYPSDFDTIVDYELKEI